jgi:hypothetical protein
MAIRGVDANLTVGKAAEQSPQAAQTAKYHEMLMDKLAARAQAQEARNAERTQSTNKTEQQGVNADGEGLGGGGSEGGQEKEQPPEEEKILLPVGAVPRPKLDISV